MHGALINYSDRAVTGDALPCDIGPPCASRTLQHLGARSAHAAPAVLSC